MLDDLEQRVTKLVTVAPPSGIFVPAQIHPLPGRFVKRGELGTIRPPLAKVVAEHTELLFIKLARCGQDFRPQHD